MKDGRKKSINRSLLALALVMMLLAVPHLGRCYHGSEHMCKLPWAESERQISGDSQSYFFISQLGLQITTHFSIIQRAMLSNKLIIPD